MGQPKPKLTKNEMNNLQRKRRAEQRIALRLSLGKKLPMDVIREIEDTMGIREKPKPPPPYIVKRDFIGPQLQLPTLDDARSDVYRRSNNWLLNHWYNIHSVFDDYKNRYKYQRITYPDVHLDGKLDDGGGGGKTYRVTKYSDGGPYRDEPTEEEMWDENTDMQQFDPTWRNYEVIERKIPDSDQYIELTPEEVLTLKRRNQYKLLFHNDRPDHYDYITDPIISSLSMHEEDYDPDAAVIVKNQYQEPDRNKGRHRADLDESESLKLRQYQDDVEYVRDPPIMSLKPPHLNSSAKNMYAVPMDPRRQLPLFEDVQQDVLRQARLADKESNRQHAIDRFNSSLHVTQHRKPRQLRN
jgi:hypothetical protein